MKYFDYGQAEIDYLSKRDKKLAAVINKIGKIEREVTPDLFEALIRSVVGQQISNKAAATVSRRLIERVGCLRPENILSLSAEDLQGCGLSFRKVSYIRGIAEAVISGELDIAGLAALPDEEIVRRLVALPGLGVWTAEMLLIFSLQRPDVLSWGDLAIRRGMMQLYSRKDLDKAAFLRYKKRYSPYGSVASLYIWALSHGD